MGAASTVALLGGTFNPVHNGHLILASWLAQYGTNGASEDIDEVWLMPTPVNPLKAVAKDASAEQRLEMLRLSLDGCTLPIRVCDIELTLPQPNYTIRTLEALTEKYPEKHFKVAIGADNWEIFPKWRDYRRILEDYGVIVYPRPGHMQEQCIHAPVVDISSTQIRRMVKEGKDIQYLVPDKVRQYIIKRRLYR